MGWTTGLPYLTYSVRITALPDDGTLARGVPTARLQTIPSTSMKAAAVRLTIMHNKMSPSSVPLRITSSPFTVASPPRLSRQCRWTDLTGMTPMVACGRAGRHHVSGSLRDWWRAGKPENRVSVGRASGG